MVDEVKADFYREEKDCGDIIFSNIVCYYSNFNKYNHKHENKTRERVRALYKRLLESRRKIIQV